MDPDDEPTQPMAKVPMREMINQCDGCRRGMPIKDGIHRNPYDAWDLQACTAERYKVT